MAKPFRGTINVDVTQLVPDWGPYTQPIAPEDTPSVLYIVLDDVGYQWYPDLVYDNHPVGQPALPSEGYHLTTDLTNKALEFMRDAKAVAPDKPFFPYYCPGACHAPHHAPKEWIDKYRGKFDMGYEAYRELVFERQKRMAVISDKAELSPINPYIDATSADGKGWPEADTVRPWGSLTDDEKRLFARMAEVYAGACPTPTTRSAGYWTTWRKAASWTTRSLSWCRTTGLPARAARTGRSTRTNFSTRSPIPSRPTCRTSTSWAARRPTTTTRPAGPGHSTPRSSCGNGTPITRAAPLTR